MSSLLRLLLGAALLAHLRREPGYELLDARKALGMIVFDDGYGARSAGDVLAVSWQLSPLGHDPDLSGRCRSGCKRTARSGLRPGGLRVALRALLASPRWAAPAAPGPEPAITGLPPKAQPRTHCQTVRHLTGSAGAPSLNQIVAVRAPERDEVRGESGDGRCGRGASGAVFGGSRRW